MLKGKIEKYRVNITIIGEFIVAIIRQLYCCHYTPIRLQIGRMWW